MKMQQYMIAKFQALINEKYTRCAQKWNETPWLQWFVYLLSVLAVGVSIYRLNKPIPWVVDDLLKIQAARNIHSVNQLWELAYHFYMGWGGRVWGEIAAQLFLMVPKSIFNKINTIGYIFLIVLLQFNISGRIKPSVSTIAYIHFALLFCLPAFGQDILWISGAANYLWASLIPLLLLGIWRKSLCYDSLSYESRLGIFLVFITGIFAGWANENVSVALIAMGFCFCCFDKKRYGKIGRYKISGVIGLLIGAALLWFAPGNFVRFAAEKHSKSIFHIVHMIVRNILVMFDPTATLILMFGFCVLLFSNRIKKKEIAVLYLAGAFTASVAFSVIGTLSGRVVFGPAILAIVAVGILYGQWQGTMGIEKVRTMLLILMVLGSYGFYKQARDGINDYAARWDYNQRIIYAEKEKGNLDVFINPITPKNKFCATYGLDDIKPQKANRHWLNSGVAKYFELHTIQSVSVEK